MMDLFMWLNDICLVIADPFLNWLLKLPRDLALVLIAVSTSLIMTIIRKWTTNQDLLKRCSEDKKALGKFIKEAKKKGDKESIKRYRGSLGLIGMKCMMAEFKPLLWVFVPIALLGTWAFNRIGFFAPKTGEPVQLIAYFPLADSGELAHIIPQDGLELASENIEGESLESNDWVCEIKPQELTKDQIEARLKPDGVAIWTLKGDAKEGAYKLKIRHKDNTYEADFKVGHEDYAPNMVPFSSTEYIPAAEFKLKEYKPFGVVPGIESVMCPPWLVGYMLIAVLMVFVFKPALKVY